MPRAPAGLIALSTYLLGVHGVIFLTGFGQIVDLVHIESAVHLDGRGGTFTGIRRCRLSPHSVAFVAFGFLQRSNVILAQSEVKSKLNSWEMATSKDNLSGL